MAARTPDTDLTDTASHLRNAIVRTSRALRQEAAGESGLSPTQTAYCHSARMTQKVKSNLLLKQILRSLTLLSIRWKNSQLKSEKQLEKEKRIRLQK